jgi:hypothetical protein
MKICPAGAELFYADGRADRQAWRSKHLLFAILRTRLIRDVHLIAIKVIWHQIQLSQLLPLPMPSVYQNIWTSSSVKPTTGFRGLQHARSVYRELSGTSNAVEKPLTVPHACDTRWLPIRACSGEYNRPMEETKNAIRHWSSKSAIMPKCCCSGLWRIKFVVFKLHAIHPVRGSDSE